MSDTNLPEVLVVDDDPGSVRTLRQHLCDSGYEVQTAENGAEALRAILAHRPSIVITDWNLPQIDGLQLCRAIRSHENVGFTYVIMIADSPKQGHTIEALDAGADEFLAKPPNLDELLARLRAVRRILDLQTELDRRNREIHQYNAQLALANETLNRMATTDELTELVNRRYAMTRLREEWALAVRYGMPLTCIMLDIDHFKSVNDTNGHDVGDLVLKETANVLIAQSRKGETVCRLGGEEFLIICPLATAEMAGNGAKRLRRAVEANVINTGDLTLSVTISAGVAQRTEFMHQPDDLLKAADKALYAAKQSGRNRECIADPYEELTPATVA